MMHPLRLTLGMKLHTMCDLIRPEVSTDTWDKIVTEVSGIGEILDRILPDDAERTDAPEPVESDGMAYSPDVTTTLESLEVQPVPVLQVIFDIVEYMEFARTSLRRNQIEAQNDAINLAEYLKVKLA